MFRARPVASLLLLASSLFSGCGGDDEEKDFTPITDAMCAAGGGEVELETCSMNRSPLPPRVMGGGLCCVSGPLTAEECAAVGGHALSDPGNGSLKGCPSGSMLIAGIADFVEGGFCCTP
jgi:hypothetical protein